MTTSTRIVLGCLLAHPEWAADALPLLSDDCFGTDSFDAALWSTLKTGYDEGRTPTVMDALSAVASPENSSALQDVTAVLHLAAHETRDSFTRHARALAEDTFQRVALRGMQRIVARAAEAGSMDWLDVLESAQQQLRKRQTTRTQYEPLTSERVKETLGNRRRRRVIPTGFSQVDERIGGFIVGQMALLCARTNVGKSTVIEALVRNQFFPLSALNLQRLAEESPGQDPYTLRRTTGWAQPPGERREVPAPHVLLLSVEDDLDDYLSRFVCDLVDVPGRDYLDDPAHAVYGQGKGEAFGVVAEALGNGRLTIADYEDEEGCEEKTFASIEGTIKGWLQATRSRCKEHGEDDPPLLVLLDYFQKIELTDDETNMTPEHRLLKRISERLHKLAKKKRFALVAAVMLLRGDSGIEPDYNGARGGSDVVQDAETVLTLWPFGPHERRAIAEAVHKEPPQPDPLSDDDDAVFQAGDQLDPVIARRAVGELLITCDKGRYVQAGWRAPLYFDREYKRITEAYEPDVFYRYDAGIRDILKEARKAAGKAKLA